MPPDVFREFLFINFMTFATCYTHFGHLPKHSISLLKQNYFMSGDLVKHMQRLKKGFTIYIMAYILILFVTVNHIQMHDKPSFPVRFMVNSHHLRGSCSGEVYCV